MDHILRAEQRLLHSDDLVEHRVIAASLVDRDELEELNADAGLVVPQESGVEKLELQPCPPCSL